MSIKSWWLTIAIAAACSAGSGTKAQELPPTSAQQRTALKHLLRVIKTPPFYALDWHELKLAAIDEPSVKQLKEALTQSKRSADGAMEQSLWVDAAAGRPEAALAFYDKNIVEHPEDKSLSNTACWARAAHGLDLPHALAVCDAAVEADAKGYTLVHRGMAKLQLGMFQAALSDFEAALSDKAFQSHPALIDAAYGRGIARLRLGDPDGKNDIRSAARANNHVATKFADLGLVE